MLNIHKNLSSASLLIGDLAALTLFVVVGQRDHETVDPTNPLLGMLPDLVAFALPWVVAGWLLGAFRFEGDMGKPGGALYRFFARSLNAWLVTALLGLLLRANLLGRAVVPTAFIAATIVFGALFLFLWRLVYAIAWRWLEKKGSKAISSSQAG